MEKREGVPEADERANYKRVIRAAEQLFKRNGFRAVTMEAVARDAAVSKATLYSYFENKDELFVAVSARMAEILRKAVAGGLDTAGRRLDERVAAAIIAKHRIVFELIRGSAHAQDLFSHKDQLAGEVFAKADQAILELLTDALRQDAKLKPTAERLARALFFGSAELAARSQSVAELEAELGAFVAVHLTGARALARRT